MTTTAVKPGLRAASASPYTPIAYTVLGVPVYSAQGGRSGGSRIEFAVGDDEGDDPEFDDDDDSGRDADDDADDDDDDEDEPAARKARRGRQQQDDGEDEDGEDADWTPPDRATWDRVTGSLKRANAEAGKRRRIGKYADKLGIDDFGTWLTERGIDPETGHPYGDDVVDPRDDTADVDQYEDDPRRGDDERSRRQRDKEHARAVLTAERRGEQKAREELMPILAEHAARLALRDAGFTGDDRQLRRIMRTIDPDELDLDLDGDSFELLGIEEAITQLQEDFPNLFEERKPARRRTAATARTATRASRGARDVDGGGRGRQQAAPKTWEEKIAAQMFERGRV